MGTITLNQRHSECKKIGFRTHPRHLGSQGSFHGSIQSSLKPFLRRAVFKVINYPLDGGHRDIKTINFEAQKMRINF